jgi:DNA invertase Pin-like site-specific DNA recombinase
MEKLSNEQLSILFNGIELVKAKSLGQVTFGRVAYLRISKDKVGKALGVQRQYDDICEACDDRAIEYWYVDNDISAFSGKLRPDYQQMCTDILSGVIRPTAEIWVLHNDRLWRNPEEPEPFRKLCYNPKVHDRDVRIRAVNSGDMDFKTATGRKRVRDDTSDAAFWSEKISENVDKKFKQKMRLGEPLGGKRKIGFLAGAMVHHEGEAAALRGAAAMILDGHSLAAATRWVNDQGIRGPQSGRRLAPADIKKALLRPSTAGIGSRRGVLYQGKWEPIIDRETQDALKVILNDPSRNVSGGSARVRYLGTGLYVCGACGLPMVAMSRVYRCRSNRWDVEKVKGSVHVSRWAGPLDEAVEALLLAKLQSADIADAIIARSAPADVDVAELRKRRADIERQITYSRSLVGKPGWGIEEIGEAVAKLTEQLYEIDRDLAPHTTVSKASQIVADGVTAEAWGQTSLEDRRAILSELATITIHRLQPTSMQRSVFNDVTVDWHI